MLMSSIKGLATLTSSSNQIIIYLSSFSFLVSNSLLINHHTNLSTTSSSIAMFHSVTSAASKVAGATSNTVSGAVSFAEHEAHKVGSTVANTVSGTISFSEDEVMKHIKALTGLGSRSAAQEYVVKEFENIKETAPGDVDVDVDLIPAAAGASDLKNVVLKLSPKNNNNNNNAILVYSSGPNDIREEEDDSTSNVAVMLELARGVSQHAGSGGLKNSIVFFFDTIEEEEGLDAAHRFIPQSPWSKDIRLVIDLEGLGIGGNKPNANQGSSVSEKASGGLKDPVIVLFGNNGEDQPLKQGVFPAQTINMKEKPLTLQDIFNQGNVQSSTDFQVYKDIEGFSGYDITSVGGNTAEYHTKNDKFELLKVGSIQHLGENMLPFILQIATESELK